MRSPVIVAGIKKTHTQNTVDWMDWKIIHPVGACELTLKDGEHLRVEVAESCLGGIQSSVNKTGCKYRGIESWGRCWSAELRSAQINKCLVLTF